jgi:aryl-alcohol dehydrogenase
MRVTAAVAREECEPFTIEDVELDEPRSDEILVEIHSVGLCQADVTIKDQWMPMPLPAVFGHEGAGIVSAVGSEVTTVVPGDKVVLTFDSCGQCSLCHSGHPAYCLELLARNLSGSRMDGSNALHGTGGEKIHGNFFCQSSFATHSVATERNVVKLDDDVDLDHAASLGCAVQSGAGTVVNRLRPEAGSSIAIFGAGSVGLSAVMAAKLVGCTTIVAVDIQPDRLGIAFELGATHVIDSSRVNPVSAIQQLTGFGVGYSVDTTGVPEAGRQAVDSLAPLGTCAILGMGPPGSELAIDMTNLLIPGRAVIGVTRGDSRPQDFIPQLIEFHDQGRLPYDRLVDTYALADINKAVEDSENGKVVKAVLKPQLG